jgi:hypothetical protein
MNKKLKVRIYKKPKEKAAKPFLRSVVMGNLYPVHPKEALFLFRDPSLDVYRLFLEPTVIVRKCDLLVIGDYEGVFKVLGQPHRFNAEELHLELFLNYKKMGEVKV